MSRGWRVVVVGIALLSAACGPAPTAGPRIQPRPREDVRSAVALRAEADGHFTAREWEAAAEAYRAVLAQDADAFEARYRLGVTLVELDRVDEAAKEFVWVIERGPADREEVRIARQWLLEAGG